MKRSHRFQFKVVGDFVEVVGYRRVARGRLARSGSLRFGRRDFRKEMSDQANQAHIGLLAEKNA